MVAAFFSNDTDMDLDQQQLQEQQQPEPEPEPEGMRMTRLRGLLDKSLHETLRACNYAAIQECFPALAAAHPEDLRDAHDKVCQFLRVEVNVKEYLLDS
jgi:hypothetical protein